MSSDSGRSHARISVIITAFDRRDFLKFAIDSVLDQTLDKDLYEIIVTKNFEDKEIDSLIKQYNLHSILFSTKSMGTMLGDAIEASRGEIICFLDDDDKFYRTKLKIVLEKFANNDDLGYFRNEFDIIKEEKSSKKAQFEVKGLLSTKVTSRETTTNRISWLLKNHADLNMSTISIRKSWVLKYLQSLREITISPDSFLFFTSIDANQTLEISSQPLTHYRIHESISHKTGDLSQFYLGIESMYRRFKQTWNIMLLRITNDHVKEFLKYHLKESDLYIHMSTKFGSRKDYYSGIFDYSRYFPIVRTMTFVMQVFIFSIFCFFPRLSRFIYYLFKKMKLQKYAFNRSGF